MPKFRKKPVANELTGEALRDEYLVKVKGWTHCAEGYCARKNQPEIEHWHPTTGDIRGTVRRPGYHTDIELALGELIAANIPYEIRCSLGGPVKIVNMNTDRVYLGYGRSRFCHCEAILKMLIEANEVKSR